MRTHAPLSIQAFADGKEGDADNGDVEPEVDAAVDELDTEEAEAEEVETPKSQDEIIEEVIICKHRHPFIVSTHRLGTLVVT